MAPATRLPLSTGALSELLLAIYASASSAGSIQHFLQQIGVHTSSVAGGLSIYDKRSHRWRTMDYFPGHAAAGEQYKTAYASARDHAASDPLMAAILAAEPGTFHVRDKLISSKQFSTHPFFTGWYTSAGYGDACATHFPLTENYDCILCFMRGKGAPPFSSLDVDLLNLLLPHIRQTLELHNVFDRLTIVSDVVQEHLLQLQQGIIVLNENAMVHYANRVAHSILGRFSEHLSIEDGRLCPLDHQARTRYELLVEQCIAAAASQGMLAGGALSVPIPDAPPIGITVYPYRRHHSIQRSITSDQGRAAVTLYDPSRPRLDSREVLRQMYHLSQAEAEVCWRISNGEGIAEIAVAMGSTRETARSRLKRIFYKTNIKRQSDLVRLVLVGPSGLINGGPTPPN